MAVHNILHIIDKFSMDGKTPSSCALLFKDWSEKYNKTKFNVSYCGLKSKDPGSIMLEDAGEKVFYLNKGKYSFSNISAIIDLIEHENVDLIHLHGYSSANFGRVAAKKKKIPAIVHEHAILKVQPHQFIADFLLKNYTTRGMAVAKAVKEFMIKGRSVPEEKIDVVYNSTNMDRFVDFNNDEIQTIKKEYNIPENFKTIGTITRLREEKGNKYFIEAVSEIVKDFPETRFLIVGEGPLKADLINQAKELNVDKYVVFTGFTKNVPLMIAAFDVNVIPSLTEGCPSALIEAMMSKKAIVATDVGGISEILKDSVTGLIIASKNSSKIAESVKRFLKDDKMAQEMGLAAYKESTQFKVENIVLQHEKIYEQVISNYK